MRAIVEQQPPSAWLEAGGNSAGRCSLLMAAVLSRHMCCMPCALQQVQGAGGHSHIKLFVRTLKRCSWEIAASVEHLAATLVYKQYCLLMVSVCLGAQLDVLP